MDGVMIHLGAHAPERRTCLRARQDARNSRPGREAGRLFPFAITPWGIPLNTYVLSDSGLLYPDRCEILAGGAMLAE
jgi:hypothetical protein